MKKLLFTIVALVSIAASAQVGIGVATANINPSAQLDVVSTSKGFLPPRMTTTERDAISSPASGLVIFNTTTNSLEYRSSTGWVMLITATATSMGAIGTATPNGATITSGVLSLAPADATNGGIVTTTAQTIAGAKTFSADILANGVTIGTGAGAIANNTAIGNASLAANTTGVGNTANGYQALKANIGGSGNTANGYQALKANIGGAKNTAIGFQSLQSNITGYNNTAIGYNSDVLTSALSNATAIGNAAIVAESNTMQLGNTAVTNVITSGKYTGSGFATPTGTNAQFLMADGTTTTLAGTGIVTMTAGVLNSPVAVLPLANGGTGSATKNFVDLTTAQTIAGSKSFNGNVQIGGTDSRGVLTVQTVANAATYAANTDPGDVGRFFVMQNTSTTNADKQFSAITLQINPFGSIGASPNGGRVLGDMRLVRNGATNSSASFVFSAFRNNSSYLDYLTLDYDNAKFSGTLTSGAVTYPNTDGATGQVLSTNGTGTLAWVSPQSGPQGSPGTAGAAGATGATGSTGATGATGSQGIQGIQGATGLAGSNATMSMGVIGAATTNGATITSGVLSLAPANATNPGIVTTGAQTIAGAKTFSADVTANSFVKSGGTAVQFLKADGSVDTNTYLTSTSLPTGTAGQTLRSNGTNWLADGAITNDGANVTIGFGNTATTNSIAMGNQTTASGLISTAMGYITTASGLSSTAMGGYTIATGDLSTAMGGYTIASGDYSTAMGDYTTASGVASTAMGNHTTASGSNSIAMGNYVSTNNLSGSFILGDNSTTSVTNSSVINSFTTRFGGGYRFYSDAAVTTANGMFLTGGNLGIGTASPTAKLEVNGALKAGGVTYPNTLGSANQVLTTDGAGLASWVTPSTLTVGAMGTATPNGATITSGVLNLAPANATNPGILTTGPQTIAGDKTFSGNMASAFINSTGLIVANNIIVTNNLTASAYIKATGNIMTSGNFIDLNPTLAAINTSATATAANIVSGYITSTTAAAVTITLPTATLIATQIGSAAAQGTSLEFSVENTGTTNAVTLAVGTGISVQTGTLAINGSNNLSVTAVNKIGRFRLVFTSATAAMLFRIY